MHTSTQSDDGQSSLGQHVTIFKKIKRPYFGEALFQLVLNSSFKQLAGRRGGDAAGLLAAQHGVVDRRKQHRRSHVLGEEL